MFLLFYNNIERQIVSYRGDNSMECKECYSDKNRITPLLGARECLENHLQYVCGTCGRCICIDKDKIRGLQV